MSLFHITLLDWALTGLHTSLMVEYLTTKRVEEQYTAFMIGFNELIPQDLINVFDEREVEHLIGGISESMFPLPLFFPASETNLSTSPYS